MPIYIIFKRLRIQIKIVKCRLVLILFKFIIISKVINKLEMKRIMYIRYTA